MTAGAAALLAEVTAAGVRLEARLWCDAPDRLAPELRNALAQERPAVLRLLLDGKAAAEGGADADVPSAPSSPASLADSAARLPSLDGYQRAALRRPPSLPPHAPPGVGCYSSCCKGRAWWCEREQPKGWRCVVCYAPVHLPAEAVRELRT